MRKLLRYLKYYKIETVLAPFFKLLEATFELIVPLVVAKIIDKGIGLSLQGYVVKMCGLLILFALIGLTCTMVAQYFAAKAAVGFGTRIRMALFTHIQNLSYSKLDTLGSSTLITRMTSDINQVQTGANLTLRLLLRSPFIVFGAMIMAFTVDARAAVTFTVVIPALLVVVFAVMLVCIPLYKKVRERLDKVLLKTNENLSGVRVIRAFCKEKEEIEEFNSDNSLLTHIQIVAGRVSALMNPATFVIINIGIIFLIYRGAIRVNSGIITQGAVVALYNYMSQILVELIKLANLIINITKSIACGNRIQSVFEIETETSKGTSTYGNRESENVVEFDHVYFGYNKNSEYALEDIDFKVKRGMTVGIIGSTGSGKSTLVNLIPGFYRSDKGAIKIDGMDVNDYEIASLRKKIGIVPQKAVLFSGTIRDNMKFSNEDATDDQINEALITAQAKSTVDGKPEGLDYMIEESGKNFSGGQRQRLTIARAIVRKPEILILDDSSSALDFATDAALRKALRNTDFNPTIFIVSQRASTIQHSDMIIVLDNGAIAGIGTNEELLKNCETYQEICNSQFKKEAEKNA